MVASRRSRVPHITVGALLLCVSLALTACSASPAPTASTSAATAPAKRGAPNIITQPANQAVIAKIVADWEDLTNAADLACQQQLLNPGADTANPYAPKAVAAAADYNLRWKNLTDAGLTGIPGYPKVAPTFQSDVVDWCQVPDQLRALRR